ASRMKSAVYETQAVKVAAGDELFTAASSKLIFKGYLEILNDEKEHSEGSAALSKLTEGQALTLKGFVPEQHFTQPPQHYTEATLVREMEERGLGRPSTYAPTITNILQKHYITKEGRNIFTTELGEVVNNLMLKSFPDVVDLGFTAQMESSLDEIAEGKLDWHKMMEEFYPGFEAEVRAAEAELEKVRVEDEISDVVCEKCGRLMVYKYGRHGKFLACPGFPECRNTKPVIEKIGVPCPKCGKDLVARRTKKGRRYYSCIDMPECDYMSWTKPGKKKGE
ncbi:MAG: topoisomerase DNA-binding C4 zinc finger domain-containing protein, partial [Lachnospiraceae bacterium]|nr:topoisomerase DNA-binding C4 zinc finger domain-containing protein [Lachnospiraceae bacterium]